MTKSTPKDMLGDWLEGRGARRKLFLKNGLCGIEIDAVVLVDNAVAHAGGLAPRDSGVPGPEGPR